jgi:GNAT superfamily N-acetyltransferase
VAAGLSLYVSKYPDCVRELIEFRNLNRRIPRDRAYFDWRYLGRPCAAAPIIVWAESESRRVGALTIFPHDFYILDGEYPLGVLGDISVRKECRGMGIAGAMFGFIAGIEAARSLHGCVVLPNEDAARPLRKSGWHDTNRIERFAKVLDFGKRFSEHAGSRLLRTLGGPLNLLTRGLTYEGLYRSRRYRADLVSHLGDSFDDLWRGAEKRGKIMGVRDARYLRWRYQHHPITNYRMLAITDGASLCGYVMYRLTDDLCFVEDAFCREPGQHATHVVGLLLTHLREQKSVSGVSVSINRSVLNFPWRKFGFLRRADYQRVMTSDCSSVNARPLAASAARWHVTTGDKDV